jgi:hypothetical protein
MNQYRARNSSTRLARSTLQDESPDHHRQDGQPHHWTCHEIDHRQVQKSVLNGRPDTF